MLQCVVRADVSSEGCSELISKSFYNIWSMLFYGHLANLGASGWYLVYDMVLQ